MKRTKGEHTKEGKWRRYLNRKERENERMECWQIEVYWEFDSKIIYSKGQSGAKQD